MPIEQMCALIEQYIYQQKGVGIKCTPDLTSQRELWLLESMAHYIMNKNGHVTFTWG